MIVRSQQQSASKTQLNGRCILVTGGAGFVGSALCRFLVLERGYRVINVDKLTYAGNLSSLDAISTSPNYRFERCDIADKTTISALLRKEGVDSVIHLAAETHVDRSIASPAAFVETNIVGTFQLLETVLDYWRGLGETSRKLFRFHHVSTDEVFGDVPYDHEGFTSVTHYRPSSPYSASKAASEHLSNAWHRTYGLPVIVSNSSNNYGPFQMPDKLVPLTILNAIQERRIPIYGTGANVRDWLYIEDHVRALDLVLRHGQIGHSYQIGARGIRTNLEVVESICRILDDLRPRPHGRSHHELIEFVPDRPGHDRRYAIDPRKAESELAWTPKETFETGLAKTIDWYLEHPDWWRPLLESGFALPLRTA